jgi:vitamin B12 transporter
MQNIFIKTLIPLSLSLPIYANDNITELSDIIVTATKTPQTIDDTLAAVTIITRQQIEQTQVQNLPDILRNVVGLDVINNGGAGQIASVFMRGTNSNQILILIDGMKLGSATTGSTALQHIPVEQIEKIEIVRGSRSSLYGSEAIGGIIHIFTSQATDKPNYAVNIVAGNQGTYQIDARASDKHNNNRYSISTSHFQTQGYDACENNLTSGCYADEPDDDAYKNQSLKINLGHNFNDKFDIEFNWLHNRGNVEFDSSYGGNESDFVQQILGLKSTFNFSDNWHSNFLIAKTNSDNKTFGNNSKVSYFDTERLTFNWQNNLDLTDNSLLTLVKSKLFCQLNVSLSVSK